MDITSERTLVHVLDHCRLFFISFLCKLAHDGNRVQATGDGGAREEYALFSFMVLSQLFLQMMKSA